MEEEHHEARVSKLENFALRFERVSKFEEVTFPDCRDPITLEKDRFPLYAKALKIVFPFWQEISYDNDSI